MSAFGVFLMFWTSAFATGISWTLSSVSETRIVSPIPSASSEPIPIALLIRASSPSPALVARLDKKSGLNYPIHLGVTEAGEGEDARIKSAIGLVRCWPTNWRYDRVSLTRGQCHEIPVAKAASPKH